MSVQRRCTSSYTLYSLPKCCSSDTRRRYINNGLATLFALFEQLFHQSVRAMRLLFFFFPTKFRYKIQNILLFFNNDKILCWDHNITTNLRATIRNRSCVVTVILLYLSRVVLCSRYTYLYIWPRLHGTVYIYNNINNKIICNYNPHSLI